MKAGCGPIHPDDRGTTLASFLAGDPRGRRLAAGAPHAASGRRVPLVPGPGRAGARRGGAIVQWLGAATDIQEQRTALEMLEARVAEATAELRNLSRRLLTIQEEERRHLARELHDEVGQALTGLSLTLATARRGGEQAHLDDAVTISDDLLERVRQLSLDLRPSILDDLGLLPALLSHYRALHAAYRGAGGHAPSRVGPALSRPMSRPPPIASSRRR